MFQRVGVEVAVKSQAPTEGFPKDPEHSAMFPGKKIPWPQEYLVVWGLVGVFLTFLIITDHKK